MPKLKGGIATTLWGGHSAGAAVTGGSGASGGGGSGNLTDDLASSRAASDIFIPQGVLGLSFGYTNLAASLTSSLAYRSIPGSTVATSQQGVTMAYRGSAVGISFRGNDVPTAGTCTFSVWIAGEQTSLSVDWNTGLLRNIATFPTGSYPFAANEEVDIRATTSSDFAPTTVDVEVTAYVTFNTE